MLFRERGHPALAPDIGGSRRDSGQIASMVAGRLCRVLRNWVFCQVLAATRKEKIPGPMTAVQGNLERTTLYRYDTSSDFVSDTRTNPPRRLESRKISEKI